MKITAVLALAVVGACSAARVDSSPSGSQTNGALVVRSDSLSPFSSNSGITVKDRMVVTDPTAWSKIWLNITGRVSPTPPLPAADFDRETIVIASMGQQRSGGYSITIDSGGVVGDTVILAVTERSPGRTCMSIAALTAPVAIARVLRPRAVIRFNEKTAVTDCG